MGFERITALLSKGCMIAGAIALLALVLLATANVGLRIVHVPFSGTYETVSFLGALVTAGALGHTQRRKDHIVVDILSDRFPPQLKRLLDVLGSAVMAALFGVVSWQLVLFGIRTSQSGELSETMKIAYHPFIYGVAAGFGVLALVLLVDFGKALLGHVEEEK